MDDRIRRAVEAFVRADDRTDPRSGAAGGCWEAALTAAGLPQALERIAELDDLAREHYEESERQFDRAGSLLDRAEAAEAQVARVREALEILQSNSTGTAASGEEGNRWDGIQEAIGDVQAALDGEAP